MVTLYSLAKQTEIGDKLRWRAKKSDVVKPEPRTVTSVEKTEERIAIEAKGPQEGQAGFFVTESGTSRAWYGSKKREMGSVDRAELVEKEIATRPWGDR